MFQIEAIYPDYCLSNVDVGYFTYTYCLFLYHYSRLLSVNFKYRYLNLYLMLLNGFFPDKHLSSAGTELFLLYLQRILYMFIIKHSKLMLVNYRHSFFSVPAFIKDFFNAYPDKLSVNNRCKCYSTPVS